MTVEAPANANATHRPATAAADWLALHAEDILDPGRRIVDAHHHLWDRASQRYLAPEFLDDAGSGHNVTASVFVECWSQYRSDGPERLRCVGETDFVVAQALSARAAAAACDVAAAIVGHADLTLGEGVDDVLEAHVTAGKGRFRGVRHAVQWEGTGTIPVVRRSPPHLLMDAAFRRGAARLAAHGMSFDAWLYQTQLPELADFARALPGLPVILNHLGGPLATGAYGADLPAQFAAWQRDMRALSACANVSVKIGGLGMATAGHGFQSRPAPPSSQEMAQAWRPWVEAAVEMFGAGRCMFESNFPVDKISGGYPCFWNAFKRLSAGCSEAEKDLLFHGTAERVYRLGAGAAR